MPSRALVYKTYEKEPMGHSRLCGITLWSGYVEAENQDAYSWREHCQKCTIPNEIWLAVLSDSAVFFEK